MKFDEDVGQKDAFKIIQSAKVKNSEEGICTGFAKCLLKFCKEVMSIKFSEKPDYHKLKKLLEEALI